MAIIRALCIAALALLIPLSPARADLDAVLASIVEYARDNHNEFPVEELLVHIQTDEGGEWLTIDGYKITPVIFNLRLSSCPVTYRLNLADTDQQEARVACSDLVQRLIPQEPLRNLAAERGPQIFARVVRWVKEHAGQKI